MPSLEKNKKTSKNLFNKQPHFALSNISTSQQAKTKAKPNKAIQNNTKQTTKNKTIQNHTKQKHQKTKAKTKPPQNKSKNKTNQDKSKSKELFLRNRLGAQAGEPMAGLEDLGEDGGEGGGLGGEGGGGKREGSKTVFCLTTKHQENYFFFFNMF